MLLVKLQNRANRLIIKPVLEAFYGMRAWLGWGLLFSFFCVWEDLAYLRVFPLWVSVCMMNDHRSGPEETLMEVTVGMNGVALSHLSRAHPRWSSFQCLLASAAMLALAIGLVAAHMVYFYHVSPRCNPVSSGWVHPCCGSGVSVC